MGHEELCDFVWLTGSNCGRKSEMAFLVVGKNIVLDNLERIRAAYGVTLGGYWRQDMGSDR